MKHLVTQSENRFKKFISFNLTFIRSTSVPGRKKLTDINFDAL